MQQAIRSSPGQQLTLTIERDGDRRDLTVTPIENTVAHAGRRRHDRPPATSASARRQAFARQSITDSPGYFGTVVADSVDRLVEIPERVPQLFRAAFLGEERDANGPIGVVGVGRISGEVFSLDRLQRAGEAELFLSLLASVNLVLFLFNLLPIYPLDGGHVAGALYEKARSTVARWRGRPDPGPFDIARLMPVAYVVAGLFIALSGLLLVPTSSTRSRCSSAVTPGHGAAAAPADAGRYWASWPSPSVSACPQRPRPSWPRAGRRGSWTWAASGSAATPRSACSR